MFLENLGSNGLLNCKKLDYSTLGKSVSMSVVGLIEKMNSVFAFAFITFAAAQSKQMHVKYCSGLSLKIINDYE